MDKIQQQQGDVCIESAKIPKTAKVKQTNVLADGEVTGHAHRVVVPEGSDATFTVLEEKGDVYLSVRDGVVELTHEEHHVQTIPAGDFKIGIVKEYDYDTEESRQVRD